MERQMITPTQQPRRSVGTYPTYTEAQRAVDHLADHNFPVERTSIVAEGIRFVEQVTGRLTWGRVLLNGAVSGALTGIFIGLIFSLFTLVPDFLPFMLYGLVGGAIVGVLIDLISYALSGG